MTGFEQVIATAAEASNRSNRQQEGDYIGPNGLLYCGKCGTPKQSRVKILGKEQEVFCLCKCGVQRREEEKKKLEEAQKYMRINRRRREGIPDQTLRTARFEAARDTDLIRKCRRWAENFADMRSLNAGLLLWGGVGVGKSYAAACVCNELLDRGLRVCMTSFPRILSAGFDQQDIFLERIHRYDLLVIDDLGVERGTDFAQETRFKVVDERYRARLPLIVTTNLTTDFMEGDNGIGDQRVFDRILEMCVPVYCGEESQRIAAGRQKLGAVKSVMM